MGRRSTTVGVGGEGFTIAVAGLCVSVEARSGGMKLAPLGCPPSFVVEAPPQPELTLDVLWRELSSADPGRLLFDSNGSWRLFEDGGVFVYRFHDSRLGAQPYKEARLGPSMDRGTILLDPRHLPAGEALDPLEFPLDELLFQRLLARHGGIELHAAGIVAPAGEGYLFAGQSGDGKTTTARLWQQLDGCRVLSDDRIIVRRGAGGAWRLHGTPWHGEAELAENAGAALQAVFVLARGSETRSEPLGRAQATALLYARGFPPAHDAAATERLVAEIESLVHDVPCRRLPFVPGSELVSFVLREAA